MKKSIILMAGLIGLALTSCDDKSDLGVMQKNEAPVVVPVDGVALKSLYASTGNAINLQDYEEIVNIPLVDIAISDQFSATSTVSGTVEVADNPDFKDAVEIALFAEDVAEGNEEVNKAAGDNTRALKGYVEVSAWEDAFVEFYDVDPTPNVNYLRYKLRLVDDNQSVILYNDNGEEWFDAMEFMVTPFDAELDVKASYTFHYTLDGKEQTPIVMFHNPDKHVYVDPTFNASITVTANPAEGEGEVETVNAIEWWVTPTGEDTMYGVMGEDPAEPKGTLGVIGGGEESAIRGQIDQAGTFKVEVNMLELTYSVQVAPPSLYVMSVSQITFEEASQLGTEDYVTYSGMAGVMGVWGLTGQDAWKPTLFVNDPAVNVTNDGFNRSGGFKLETSGNVLNNNSGISFPGTAGLGYFQVDLQANTYKVYQCKEMGLVGDFNQWGTDEATKEDIPDAELKGSRQTKYMVWSGTLKVEKDQGWKVRANHDWAVNFGLAEGSSFHADGEPINLSMGGDNIVATESGEFTVTVYFQRTLQEDGTMSPYYLTVVPVEAAK
ncbi:MAG: hypothetical protein J1F07_06560 [Muribaculaceae bacterium]|nr:hypothetical protein [Muribaculaceae bacterium]